MNHELNDNARRIFNGKITKLLYLKGKLEHEKIVSAGSVCENWRMKTDWKRLEELAITEVEAPLAALPTALREQAQQLPITLECVPNVDLQNDGIAIDTLGLFTGAEFAEIRGEVLPSQIILFLENIWKFAEGDERVFCEEVYTTFLHELGHFFGLEEDDLLERGLE